MAAPVSTGAPGTLLAVRGLHAGYGGSEVLHGVDLEVGAGEVVALLGRNGMGKTTLVRDLGLLRPARARSVRRPAIAGLAPTGRGPASARAEGRQIFPTSASRAPQRLRTRVGARRQPLTVERASSCFPACGSGAVTWATSSPAASSRCWPSPGRW